MSTSALIGRSPIAVRRRCIHSGDGPFLTPRTSLKAKAGHSDGVDPNSSFTCTGQGNSPFTGLIAASLNLPMSAAERSRAMPCTAVQSPRFGVRLISITGSSSFAHVAYGLPTGASAGSSMMPSWSSEIISSASDTSMPRLSTPRMVPTPSVMFLPGMKVPGGENTPIRSARAFGAPHTTWIGLPSPVSTMHTRSRSAFGCCTAETTRAMVNGASALALSSTLSTSSPIMVSLSASADTDASVSRCSLSQERVNFIARHSSRTQAAGQRRQVERAEAVMREPAHVGFEEGAQVRHAVLQHGDAVDPHTPGEPLVLVRIDAAVLEHVRMHHSTAEDLHPVLAFA